MDRTAILDHMATLKLYGMRAAYDEIMAVSIKRQHEPPRVAQPNVPSRRSSLCVPPGHARATWQRRQAEPRCHRTPRCKPR